MTAGAESGGYYLKGVLLGACDWGCPCNFDAPPTDGRCHGTWAWDIHEGRFGEVPLAGLSIASAGEWPGAIHLGHGTVQHVIDSRATSPQREALLCLLNGGAGGPFAIFAAVTETFLEPIYAPFEASINGLDSRVFVPGVLEIGLTSIKNPVTGVPEEMKLLKRTGITSLESDLGASTVYRYSGGFQHDHSGKYGEFAPFDYRGSWP